MISAFGVEHGGISKADQEKTKHYGRMAGITGGIGGAAGAVGAGTAAVGLAEKKGRDPMAFSTIVNDPSTKRRFSASQTAARKGRILARVSRSHFKQAGVAGGIAAGGAGLSAAYHHAKKQELAKAWSEKNKSRAREAGAAGLGAGAAAGGGYNTWALGSTAASHGNAAYHTRKVVKAPKGTYKVTAREMKAFKNNLPKHYTVAGVKGAGALASAGVGAAGIAGLAHQARHYQQNRKSS